MSFQTELPFSHGVRAEAKRGKRFVPGAVCCCFLGLRVIVAGLLDRMGWLKASSNLRAAFKRSEEIAMLEAGHGETAPTDNKEGILIEPDHLLAGLLDDPEAAVLLELSGFSRKMIFEALSWPRRTSSNFNTFSQEVLETCALVPSMELRKLIAHACEIAEAAKKHEIDGSDIVKALFDLKHLLKNQAVLAKPEVNGQNSQQNRAGHVPHASPQRRISDKVEVKEGAFANERGKQGGILPNGVPHVLLPEVDADEKKARAEKKSDVLGRVKKGRKNTVSVSQKQAEPLGNLHDVKVMSHKRTLKKAPGKALLPPRPQKKKVEIIKSSQIQTEKITDGLPQNPEVAFEGDENTLPLEDWSVKPESGVRAPAKAKLPSRREKSGADVSFQNQGKRTVGHPLAKVDFKREERKAEMNRTYFDAGLPENTHVHQSVETLLAGRKKAEAALADCEWYDLLISLGRVSDDLESEDQIHRIELIDKAYEEIDKVPRWRKAIAFIQYLDSELAKLHLGEHIEVRTEFAGRPQADMSKAEASSDFLDGRLHSIESHMRELEKMLLRQQKKSKRKKPKSVKPVSVTSSTFPGPISVKPDASAREEDQEIIRSLQSQIARLDEQNRVLSRSKQALESKIEELDEKQRTLLARSEEIFKSQADREHSYQDELGQLKELRDQISRLDEQNQRLLLEKSDAEARISRLSEKSAELSSLQARVEKLDAQNEELQRAKRSLEAKIEELSERSRDYPHVQEQKALLEEQNRILKQARADLEKQVQKLDEGRRELSIRTTHLEREKASQEREKEKKLEENRSLQAQLMTAQNQMFLLKEKAQSRKRQLLVSGERGHSRREDVVRLEKANARLLEDVEVLTAEIRSRDGDIQSMNRRMDNLRSELDKARSEARDMFHLRAERNRMKAEIDNLNEQLANQEALRSKISSLHGKLADEVSLAGTLADHQEKIIFLKQDNKRISEKAMRRKSYIRELEEQVEKLEVRVRHAEYQAGEYAKTSERLVQLEREARERDNKIHDYKEYIRALEKDAETSKQEMKGRVGYVASLEEKVRSFEQYSKSKDASLKRYQEEVREKDEELLNIRGKLNLEKEKSVTRERHVRALEQHTKALQAQIDELKANAASTATLLVAAKEKAEKKAEGDDLVEIIGHGMGYYTVASPSTIRYDEGLVEIIREG